MSNAPDQPGAVWMPVPQSNVFSGYFGHTPKWIVVHKTASGGTAQDIAHWFQTQSNESVHYIVGQDGTIVQCVSESDGAGGNCCTNPGHAAFLPDADGTSFNMNWVTISIEHCDPAPDNSTPLTPAQQAASFRLIYDLCQRHTIPMRPGDAQGGIIGHSNIAPLQKPHCPGNYPWQALFTSLSQQEQPPMIIDPSTNPTVAAYFTAIDAHHWHCSNGFMIQDGILDFYRSFANTGLCGLTHLGLPRSNETPIEEISPVYAKLTGKGVVIQRFERADVLYDPARLVDNPPGSGPIYLAHIDQLPGLDPRLAAIAAARADISACAKLIGDTATHILSTSNTLGN